MRKRIRQFFWILSLTGGLLAFQAFVKPSALKDMVSSGQKQMEEVSYGQGPSEKSVVEKVLDSGMALVQRGIDSTCSSCTFKVYDFEKSKEESRHRVRVLVPIERKKTKEGGAVYEERAEDSKLVYKDGKYHKAIERNVYYDINGNPTLVIDNAQERYAKVDEEEDSSRTSGTMGRQRQSTDGAFVDSGGPEGLEAYGPTSVKEMAQTLKAAKQNMIERNKTLKQLGKEDKTYRKKATY